jgi:hypothetical protein
MANGISGAGASVLPVGQDVNAAVAGRLIEILVPRRRPDRDAVDIR